jgi:hypothetical protein
MDTQYDARILPVAELDLLEIDQYLSQFYSSTPAKFFKEFEKHRTHAPCVRRFSSPSNKPLPPGTFLIVITGIIW